VTKFLFSVYIASASLSSNWIDINCFFVNALYVSNALMTQKLRFCRIAGATGSCASFDSTDRPVANARVVFRTDRSLAFWRKVSFMRLVTVLGKGLKRVQSYFCFANEVPARFIGENTISQL